jgi:hypothetical protein
MHLTPKRARPSPNQSDGRAFSEESVGGGVGSSAGAGVSAGSVAPEAPTGRRLRFSSDSGARGRSKVVEEASAMELEPTEIENSLAQGGAVDTAAQGGAVDTADEQVFEGGVVSRRTSHRRTNTAVSEVDLARDPLSPSPTQKRRRDQAGKKRQTARGKIKCHRRFAHARGRRLRKTAQSGYVDGLIFEGDFEPCV